MKGAANPGTGSLDMLLDTMCNTFGGVCFIALMVAILSAMSPKQQDGSKTGMVTEQMLVDQEKARLVRRRDELKSAIEIQKSFDFFEHYHSSEYLLSHILVSSLFSRIPSKARALSSAVFPIRSWKLSTSYPRTKLIEFKL